MLTGCESCVLFGAALWRLLTLWCLLTLNSVRVLFHGMSRGTRTLAACRHSRCQCFGALCLVGCFAYENGMAVSLIWSQAQPIVC